MIVFLVTPNCSAACGGVTVTAFISRLSVYVCRRVTPFLIAVKWQIVTVVLVSFGMAALAAGGWLSLRESALLVVACALVLSR